MSYHYSSPVDELIESQLPATDVLVVGSGYGGAIAAARLAGSRFQATNNQLQVTVLERGMEYQTGEFPSDITNIPGKVRISTPEGTYPKGNADALFDVHIGKGVDVLVGSGLGGTSLINANVAIRPENEQFARSPWPSALTQDSRLDDAFDRVSHLLGVNRLPDDKLKQLKKYQSFKQLAESLRKTCTNIRLEAAPITVTTESGNNAVGLHQNACTLCGNCITGCNVGAKNTLMHNFVPLAAARGAQFYTGATVLWIEPIQQDEVYRWRVAYIRTRSIKTPLEGEIFYLKARHVILAAGSLGSTEILARTKQLETLTLSKKVGKSFSTNGDAIGFSFGHKHKVNGVGRGDVLAEPDEQACGPTITAWARIDIPATKHCFKQRYPKQTVVLEDGAVPYGLSQVFTEVMPTLAQLQRLGSNQLPGYFSDSTPPKDPLRTYPDQKLYCQTLLMMGDDQPDGFLEFKYSERNDKIHRHMPDRDRHLRLTGIQAGHIVPYWTGDDAHLKPIHLQLEAQNLGDGMDTGQYIPNPLWQLIPKSAESFMTGKFPGGRLLSVHPLGGCPMAEHGDEGVVNHRCEVFHGNSDKALPGLYVMDGAIIPAAIGANPFLTIAALTWRAVDFLLDRENLIESTTHQVPPAPQPVYPHWHTPEPARVKLRERMVGKLDAPDTNNRNPIPDWLERFYQSDGMILDIHYQPTDFLKTLANNGTLECSVCLYKNPVNEQTVLDTHAYGVPDAHLKKNCLVATGKGTFRLLDADLPKGTEKFTRAIMSLSTYLHRRDGVLAIIKHQLSNGKSISLANSLGFVKGFWKLAAMHSEYRHFKYSFKLQTRDDHQHIDITGQKSLMWDHHQPRFWDSLLNLEGAFRCSSLSVDTKTILQVDMGHMVGNGLLQVDDSPDTPASLMQLGALSSFFLRCVLHTSFWEFGSPGYPKQEGSEYKKYLPDLAVPPLRTKWDKDICPVPYPFEVMLTNDSQVKITLELNRYPNTGKPPLLLIHGLAQGSRIFTTPTITQNMVQHMYEAGFDVWVLDYRLSNRIFPELNTDEKKDWAIDEIGQFDIPEAINLVLHTTRFEKLSVFAHCVGAVATQMAILANHQKISTKIDTIIFNAIHPWVTPSPNNLVRARLGNYLRNMMNDLLLDPVLHPKDKSDALKTLFDRFAFSMARLSEGEHQQHPRSHKAEDNIQQGICDRMSTLYGRMWNHQNLSEDLVKRWQDLVGPAPVNVYQHLFYMVSRRRLLNRDGENLYLTSENLHKYWQQIRTCFIHGEDSKVFNPRSANESAHALRNYTAATVACWRIEGYGHMDVIIGKDASEDIYPQLANFFHGKPTCFENTKLPPSSNYGDRARIHPATGPIFRGAKAENGRLALEYWVEMPQFNTLSLEDILIQGIDPQPEVRVTPLSQSQEFYLISIVIAPEHYQAPSFFARLSQGGSESDQLSNKELFAIYDSAPILQTFLSKQAAGDSQHAQPNWSLTIDFGSSDNKDSELPAWIQKRCFPEPEDTIEFICGSCRYPGTPFERDQSDRIFASMQKAAAKNANLDGIFLLGDQIYADATADVFEDGNWRDRYDERYRSAFNSPHFAALVKERPVYFCVDDHEFTQNWSGSGDALLKADISNLESGHLNTSQFEYAQRKAKLFMGYRNQQLWHVMDPTEFSCPAFMMDTRSSREVRSSGKNASMLDDTQLGALQKWFEDIRHIDKPKLLFSGIVFAPLTRDFIKHPSLYRQEEGFWGYPETLGKLLDEVAEHSIKNLIFIGGDLHISCKADITIYSQPKSGAESITTQTQQIVTSGLFAPLPFANDQFSEYDWDKKITIKQSINTEHYTHRVEYTATPISDHPSHYLKVKLYKQGHWKTDIELSYAS